MNLNIKLNRLVLIGNGFDLSIGLKTSYEYFIAWLKTYYIKETINSKTKIFPYQDFLFYEDENFEIEIDRYVAHNCEAFLEHLPNMPRSEQKNQILKFLNHEKENISITPKNKFIADIEDTIKSTGWVNIENTFYKHLVKAKRDDVISINRSLDCLKNHLKTYLIDEQKFISDDPNRYWDLFRSFRKILQSTDQISNELNPESYAKNYRILLDRIQIVNFNYTNTVTKLVKSINLEERESFNEIIHIHGGLDDTMIFGYGDEDDEDYPKLENSGYNPYLEHVKSFRYLQNSSYYNLIRFINSAPYQVIILGHSCGLSDRTMLKEIFENENCISIKPYYYQRSEQLEDNDYFDKIMEISRHFSDNGMMRKKVVSFEKCQAMPILN